MTGARVSVVLTLVAAASLGSPGVSSAEVPAASGSLRMTSDPDHRIGEGQTYTYPASVITLGPIAAEAEGAIGVRVRVQTDVSWTIELWAPEGSVVRPGVYRDTRDVRDGTHPGLNVFGIGSTCRWSTGTFTVRRIEYGPAPLRAVRLLHATFEHRCEGGAAALRGKIDLVAERPPPPLKIDLTFDPERSVVDSDGKTIELQGTIRCSQVVGTAVIGAAVIEADVGPEPDDLMSQGSLGVSNCSEVAAPWRIVMTSRLPRAPGAPPRARVSATAQDPWLQRNGLTVFAEDSVENATVSLEGGSQDEQASPVSLSSTPVWPLIGVLVAAGIGWALILLRWARHRNGDRRT